MYETLPFILIIVSLAIIVVIIVRRFPQLTLIDAENLPEVQQERKKDEFLKQRVKSKSKEKQSKWTTWFAGVVTWWKELQLQFRKYVGTVERRLVQRTEEKKKSEPTEKRMERAHEVEELIKEANQAADAGELEKAEQRYIQAIRLDAKNVDAYYGLSGVYMRQEQLTEAQQSCAFALQLDPDNDLAAVRMAEIAEQQGDVQKAIEWYQQSVLTGDMYPKRFDKLAHLLQGIGEHDAALEAAAQAADLEPENPKYLDNLLELAIIVADKTLAEDVYGRLRLVNPENQKLRVFRQRIDEITPKQQ